MVKKLWEKIALIFRSIGYSAENVRGAE